MMADDGHMSMGGNSVGGGIGGSHVNEGSPLRRTYATFVFDDRAMEHHLPHEAYKKMRILKKKGGVLDAELADSVAFGMKEWAMQKGASSFAHWFHPLTDKTAQKFDAFLTLRDHLGQQSSGHMLSQFSGNQLVQGESDGSSFPSGGLRRTSEARGYSAWDYTSPPFVIGADLIIPAVFCSIFGLSLDQRTPLLRSERCVQEAALRAIHQIAKCVKKTPATATATASSMMNVTPASSVTPSSSRTPSPDHHQTRSRIGSGSGRSGVGMVEEEEEATTTEVYLTMGAEQEFFIVDRKKFEQRPDLVSCGRTLIGGAPTKGQELSDHYWATMPMKIRDVLLNTQGRLWELGVPVTTAHNEVAPKQYELASTYERGSVASDHNMVLMKILEEECEKQGLACLMHEKPFYRWVNGSGKHTNWSMSTDTGVNLFSPGTDPRSNVQFLFFLAAFLRGAHVHNDVLRSAIAVPGNEFRLGGMEAPPAIISVFLGSELGRVVEEIISGKAMTGAERIETVLDLGINLPKLKMDTSDRNRTSPMAFTGNRFEFRAVGSSQNCAWPVTCLNAVVASSLHAMCDEMEEMMIEKGGSNGGGEVSSSGGGGGVSSGGGVTTMSRAQALQKVIRDTLIKHNAIVYNGDCYDEAYIEEMTKRGIPNLRTTPAALASLNSSKNKALFDGLSIMNEAEVESRAIVQAEYYCHTRQIEAQTMINMVETMVIPAAIKFEEKVANGFMAVRAALGTGCGCGCGGVGGGGSGNGEPSSLAPQKQKLVTLVELIAQTCSGLDKLKKALEVSKGVEEPLPRAFSFHDEVMESMEQLRVFCDQLEKTVERSMWPFPTITDLCAPF